MFVAPVRVGDGAMTAAGSVITKDVPPGALAIERSEQKNVPGFGSGSSSGARPERVNFISYVRNRRLYRAA